MAAGFRRFVARLLIIAMAALGLPVPAQAGLLPTEAAVSSTVPAGPERERLAALVDRADVRAQLEAYGVSPDEVKARVNAMTDEEAALVAARVDELPAGGVGIVGAIVLVFVVLLITDILGFTKVFPFTRSINK